MADLLPVTMLRAPYTPTSHLHTRLAANGNGFYVTSRSAGGKVNSSTSTVFPHPSLTLLRRRA